MNEASETLREYLSNDTNTVHYHGAGEGVFFFKDMLEHGRIIEGDAPDLCIAKDNFLLIIEHFEFDCYKANRKGSSSKIEQQRIDREIQQLNVPLEGRTYHHIINAESSYKDYCKNIKKNFEKHSKKIKQYKDNLARTGNITETTVIRVLFLINDTSPLGASYVDAEGNWRPVVLAHSKEFLVLLKNTEDIDYVFSTSSSGEAKYVWFIDKADIADYFLYTEDYEGGCFLNYKPHVVGWVKPI